MSNKKPADLNNDGYVSPEEAWEWSGKAATSTPQSGGGLVIDYLQGQQEKKRQDAVSATNKIASDSEITNRYLTSQSTMLNGSNSGSWRYVDNTLIYVPSNKDGVAGSNFALIAQDSDKTKWATNSIDPSSPASISDYAEQYFKNLASVPNGVANLREQLISKNIFSDSDAVSSKQLSASNPNYADYYLRAKVAELIGYASTENYNRTVVNKEKNLITLDEFINSLGKKDSTGGGGGMGGTRTTITRQDFQADDYREALDQMFMEYSGRGASERELNSFISTLKKMEAKNPQKTVNTTSGNTTVSKQTGGISQDAVMSQMKKEALAEPNAEDYNKATKFMDMFINSLGTNIELGA